MFDTWWYIFFRKNKHLMLNSIYKFSKQGINKKRMKEHERQEVDGINTKSDRK